MTSTSECFGLRRQTYDAVYNQAASRGLGVRLSSGGFRTLSGCNLAHPYTVAALSALTDAERKALVMNGPLAHSDSALIGATLVAPPAPKRPKRSKRRRPSDNKQHDTASSDAHADKEELQFAFDDEDDFGTAVRQL